MLRIFALDVYKRQLGMPMTQEQFRHLISQSQQGDQAARSRLVEANLPLVHSIARRFLERGLEYEDLVQKMCIRDRV